MAEERPTTLSYLLRLWRADGRERQREKVTWRASLEDAQTGEQKGFASLNHLLRFLRERTRGQVEGAVKEPPDYLSYLLRLWRVDGGEGPEPVWRASLESSRTGQRVAFASLDDLFDFLREQTGVSVTFPKAGNREGKS